MPPRGKKRIRMEDDLGEETAEAAPAEPATKTEAIIQSVLQEEDQTKEQSKAHKPRKEKGVEVEQVEAAQEDGVVLPSRIKQTREERRKARAKADDTELLPDNEVTAAEEALEKPEDDGIQLEPFNLAQERAEGHFDESGHYIENRGKDDVNDAWLNSEEAAEVSEAVKRAAAERERAMEAADEAPVMSTVQMAQLKSLIAEVLKPGETVTGGLKRLGAAAGSGQRRPGKRGGSAPPGKGGQPAGAQAATPAEMAAAKADFNRLTEAASQLMDSGELDVYSLKQEEFARAASLFATKPATEAAEKDMFADSDGDDDMFADSDAEGDKPKGPSGKAKKPQAAAAAPDPQSAEAQSAAGGQIAAADKAAAAGSAAPASSADAVSAGAGRADTSGASAAAELDYSSWPIKELQRFLRERGQDPSGVVEKGDLVAKVRTAAAAAPGDTEGVPAGYAFDAESGYYYSEQSRMFYDAASGGYFSQDDGNWYTWDGATFVAHSKT